MKSLFDLRKQLSSVKAWIEHKEADANLCYVLINEIIEDHENKIDISAKLQLLKLTIEQL